MTARAILLKGGRLVDPSQSEPACVRDADVAERHPASPPFGLVSDALTRADPARSVACRWQAR